MRRLFIIGLLLTCISLLLLDLAYAQQPAQEPVKKSEPIKPYAFFTWATKTATPDWGRGGLFAGLGLIGAMVTIFGLIGGAVPGTAGQTKIDEDTDRLDRLSKRLEDLISASPLDAETIGVVEKTVNNLRDDLRGERWRQFLIATALYAILGAFFSALLAQDILQAVAIGAGWTGLLGTLGLKKDFAARKATKDASLEKIISRAREVEQKLKEKVTPDEIVGLEPLENLEREVRLAQLL